MGTNYYRVISKKEISNRHEILKQRINTLLDTKEQAMWIERGFRNLSIENDFDHTSAWDEFLRDASVHLGKRSGGWKFCWNFHKDKYYKNKEELFAFIRSGRVVDEYGTEIPAEEFIEMALTWHPDGWDVESYYKDNPKDKLTWFDYTNHYDRYVDGLRVSSATEFS